MDDKTNDDIAEANELLKNLLVQSGVYSQGLHGSTGIAHNNNCVQSRFDYTRATSKLTIGLISDEIAKELHEAVALGGESVKKSLHVTYADPNQLEVMDALVDMCVAYIGEEVTAVLRKHSNIF